ncbi:TPA: ead/Ea22-like family protein [Klebsiella variicola subsp. variicola]|nr:ead/Ea22-like family protein [Klebsiella variicola subsp. variicola]
MTDITELTAEKLEEIRQRYRPTLAPKCHICGVEMTIQRMSASRITYGCAGAFYDETGCHYAEGRSLADDHYAESRITVVDVSDPDVLAMVEALEKARLSIAELEREQEHLRPVGVMSEKAFYRLENSECRFIALWPRPGIFLPRKRPEDGVIVYARTAAPQEVKP